jgi:hypothetical protein
VVPVVQAAEVALKSPGSQQEDRLHQDLLVRAVVQVRQKNDDREAKEETTDLADRQESGLVASAGRNPVQWVADLQPQAQKLGVSGNVLASVEEVVPRPLERRGIERLVIEQHLLLGRSLVIVIKPQRRLSLFQQPRQPDHLEADRILQTWVHRHQLHTEPLPVAKVP